MFIRKRTRKLKNGEVTINFQAVESFRENRKVKQKVLSLGKCSDPRKVLKEELRFLERTKKELAVPISEYKEIRHRANLGLVVVTLTKKEAEKKRSKLLEKYEKQVKRISKLDSLVCRHK